MLVFFEFMWLEPSGLDHASSIHADNRFGIAEIFLWNLSIIYSSNSFVRDEGFGAFGPSSF